MRNYEMENYILLFAVFSVHQGVAQQFNESCGHVEWAGSIIVGPKSPQPGDWPWMAAIFMQESGNEKKAICGGALISPRHILTAAVCVSGRRRTTQPAGLPSVRLGVVDLHSTGDDTRAINVDVKAIHRHPNFNVRTYNNDVALLELSKEVPFSEFVRPVCLPLGEISMKNLTRRRASVVGWGHPTNVVERNSDRLLEDYVDIWAEAECLEVYRRFPLDKETQMCAGDYRTGADPCRVTAGGSLLSFFGDRFYVLGLVSAGYRCGTAGYPGIYTRISSHLDWIQGILNSR
ncbi:putative secreted salivary gland peptide [Ixodes scapularis]